MKKVVLFAASAATLVQFTKKDLTALQTLGAEIHMVCSTKEQVVSQKAIDSLNQTYSKLIWHEIGFSDSALHAFQNRKAAKELEQLLQEIQPNLLHCHGTVAGYYGRKIAEKLEIPVFYTAHDFRVFKGCRLWERMHYSRIEKKYGKNTDVFFAVCPEDAEYVEKKIKPKSCVELPDVGLDVEYYSTPKKTRAEMRQELGLAEDDMVLLSVGALRMHKRYRVVMQAMARLTQEKNLHYVICGSGPDQKFLEDLAKRLHLESRVHLIGYRSDIPDVLGMADVFCMPSRREGCGMAVLEAMAAGLPVVAARSHGLKSFLEPKENALCLKKSDLVGSCTTAIFRLCTDNVLRRALGAKNRSDAVKYQDDKIMKEMRKHYNDILN